MKPNCEDHAWKLSMSSNHCVGRISRACCSNLVVIRPCRSFVYYYGYCLNYDHCSLAAADYHFYAMRVWLPSDLEWISPAPHHRLRLTYFRFPSPLLFHILILSRAPSSLSSMLRCSHRSFCDPCCLCQLASADVPYFFLRFYRIQRRVVTYFSNIGDIC